MATAFRSRMSARGPLVGTVLTLPDIGLAELSASAFDFVWIDMEHGALGCGDVLALAIAARAAGAASLVRIRHADDGAIGALLDAGVDGIVVPRVEGAGGAAKVVDRLSYPPAGSRGFAARRATAYGRHAGPPARPISMVQIETEAAVDDAEAIASVDGVDALVVGCADLALSLVGEANPHSAEFRDAVTRVQEAAESADIPSGIAGPDDPVLLTDLAARASTLLVLAADVRIYARALDDCARKLRQELALRAPEQEESHVST
jgi:4-hydroxy-2-oxoheptanedioate aldolase